MVRMNLTPMPLFRSLLTTLLITTLSAPGEPGSMVRCFLLRTLFKAVDNSVMVPIQIPSVCFSTTEEMLRKTMSLTLFVAEILRPFVLLLDAILLLTFLVSLLDRGYRFDRVKHEVSAAKNSMPREHHIKELVLWS